MPLVCLTPPPFWVKTAPQKAKNYVQLVCSLSATNEAQPIGPCHVLVQALANFRWVCYFMLEVRGSQMPWR